MNSCLLGNNETDFIFLHILQVRTYGAHTTHNYWSLMQETNKYIPLIQIYRNRNNADDSINLEIPCYAYSNWINDWSEVFLSMKHAAYSIFLCYHLNLAHHIDSMRQMYKTSRTHLLNCNKITHSLFKSRHCYSKTLF